MFVPPVAIELLCLLGVEVSLFFEYCWNTYEMLFCLQFSILMTRHSEKEDWCFGVNFPVLFKISFPQIA